jgi:outer membrane receptor protein involved in Fe transport
LSASKGRFGVSANGGSFFSWPRPSTTTFLRENTVDDATLVQRQVGDGESQFIGFNGSINAFYDINAYNSVTSTFRLNGRQFNRDGINEIYFSNPLRSLVQQYNSLYDAKNLNSGFDWVTDYKIKPDDTERELTFALQLTGNADDRTTDLIQKDLLGTAQDLELSQLRNNDGKNLETTLQTDYVHPFNKNIKLETGVKGVIRRIESDYNTFDRVLNTTLNDPSQSNIFSYQQDVYAGYASFNFKIGKNYGLIAGGRYERTVISGEFDLENAPFDNDYDNFLPSLIVSRNFKNFQTLKLSYSRRIQRPSLFYINPFSDITDTRNQVFGNPELEPEISDQIDLSYNTFIKGIGLNGSFYYKRTSDVIETFLQEIDQEGIAQTTYKNIGVNDSYGVNLFSTATIKRKFTIRGSLNVFTYDASATINGEQLSTTAVLWSGFGSAGLDLKDGIKVEAFGFFRSPQQTIQGFTPSFSIFGLGAKKDLFKKKGSLGIRIIEPFAKFKSFGTEIAGSNFRLESEYKILFRSFGGTFEYRFGSMNYQQRERRSKIRNSDLKEGGDNQQGNGPQ